MNRDHFVLCLELQIMCQCGVHNIVRRQNKHIYTGFYTWVLYTECESLDHRPETEQTHLYRVLHVGIIH